MLNPILSHIESASRQKKKQLAVLIDPDKQDNESALRTLVQSCHEAQADFIFCGGSLLTRGDLDHTLAILKSESRVPVLIFPGSGTQVSALADAILLLSLISGRNPDLLIGQHVQAAPLLRKTGIEILPTGYLLIESGRLTTALYMSHTVPIPADKPEIAACTAMAGEMLGLKLMYLDAGSGAAEKIPAALIRSVREAVACPLLVGGGIRSVEDAQAAWDAGADIVVIGTAIEQDPELLRHFATRE